MSTPTDVGHGRLSTAVSTIVDASTASDARQIVQAIFHNTHTSVVTVTVYYTRSGETSASDGALVSAKNIPPSKTWKCLSLMGQVIRQSATIQAAASVDDVIDYNISVNVG